MSVTRLVRRSHRNKKRGKGKKEKKICRMSLERFLKEGLFL